MAARPVCAVRAAPIQPSVASTRRDNTVPIAAPGRPRCRPKIKIGSTIAVASAAKSVTFIARFASPMQRSSPEQPIPAASSGREGDEIIRKVSARSLVSPVAPSTSRIGPSMATVTRPTMRPANTIRTRALPARCRAARSAPAPMLRATTALVPMVRPISTEVWKKPITPANPTAAAIGRWPRSEM